MLTLIEFLPLFHLRKPSFQSAFQNLKTIAKCNCNLCVRNHITPGILGFGCKVLSLAATTVSKNFCHTRGFQVGVLAASQHSRSSSCAGHPGSRGLSQLLSRGSSASYGPASRKLSYRGTLGREQLGAMGVSCF